MYNITKGWFSVDVTSQQHLVRRVLSQQDNLYKLKLYRIWDKLAGIFDLGRKACLTQSQSQDNAVVCSDNSTQGSLFGIKTTTDTAGGGQNNGTKQWSIMWPQRI